MASGFPFALLLCLSIGLSAPSVTNRRHAKLPQKLTCKSQLATERERSINITCFTQRSLLLAGTMKENMSPCPPGWTQFGSRCFSFNFQGKSWINAENFCKSAGGNLASIHSAEENEFLRTFVNQVSGENKLTWIGGFDSVKEDMWLWSDGSIFNYKRWGPGQPDNYGGAEHCLHLNHQDNWNDDSCDKILPFVCSMNL